MESSIRQVLGNTNRSGFFSAYSSLNTDDVLLSIKKGIGLGNINRLALTFSRLTTEQLFVLLLQNQWLITLSRCLQIPLNIDEIITRAEATGAEILKK